MRVKQVSRLLPAITLAFLAMTGCSRSPAPDGTPTAPALPAAPALDLAEADIGNLQARMRDGTLTSRMITEWYLARIAAVDDAGPTLNAVIAMNPDALRIADQLDEERRAGRLRGPLHGVPILLKDNIDTGDRQLTTAGSLSLSDVPAASDAEVTRRLREAGAVILGKANLSEWANIRSTRSSSGWSAVGGQTRNPYVLDRTPCGSSSGSAVAVSANLAAAAIGTETDGSITCPASMNGIAGFKPTVGLVSRRGIVPVALSQDTAGPMARTIADAAIVLDAMAGTDPQDPATAAIPAGRTHGFAAALESASLKGRRLGIVRRIGGDDDRGRPVLEAVIATLEAQGAEVIDPVELTPDAEYQDDEATVLLHELKDDLDAYLAARSNPTVRSLADVIAFNERESARELRWFGQELFVSAQATDGRDSAAYRKARDRTKRLAGAEGIDAALRRHRLDALVALTLSPAWTIDLVNGDNLANVFWITTPAAVAGYPHATVPAGFVHELPVGVSFFASAWHDAEVLALAHAFEQAHQARRAPQYLATVPAE